MSDLIDKQVVLDTIHLFFTEEINKIPTKKTEDGEVLIMCKAQPLFAMNKTLCKRIKALPSVTAEPMTDTWSIKDVAKALERYGLLEPKPKTGHWEWVQYDYNPKLGNWHCSECRCIVVECVDKEEKGGIPLYKYCPQCGAKMQEAEIEG